MQYYYVHDLDEISNITAKQLSKTLERDVTVLHWEKYKDFRNNLYLMINELKKEKDDIILIGSGLGAYYANALANALQVPCALFNPVINPKETLNKLKADSKIHSFNDSILYMLIHTYHTPKDTVIPRVVVVGLEDTMTNPYESIKYWCDRCDLRVAINAGHKISNFGVFKKAILELENLFFIDLGEI